MYQSAVDFGVVAISESANHTVFSFHSPKDKSHFLFDLVVNRLILIVVHESSLRYYSLDDKSELFDYCSIQETIHDYYASTLLNQDAGNQGLCEYVNYISMVSQKNYG